jgi:hypothetical protein
MQFLVLDKKFCGRIFCKFKKKIPAEIPFFSDSLIKFIKKIIEIMKYF